MSFDYFHKIYSILIVLSDFIILGISTRLSPDTFLTRTMASPGLLRLREKLSL